MVMLIVDGNNVVGSVPDGWWRDLPGAVRRLLGRLVCLRRRVDVEIILVLDVAQSDLPEGDHDGIEVRYPQRPGPNAADGKILELLAEFQAGSAHQPDVGGAMGDGVGDAHDGGDSAPRDPRSPGALHDRVEVEVVTSDRALASSAADAGASVTGARTFLSRLDELGC